MLSWVALQNYQRAVQACLWVVGGALIGGCAIWFIGRSNPEPLRALFASLPAVSDAMIADVRQQLEQDGLQALFIGPLIGTPYKLYALEAGNIGFGLIIFLLISIPARLIRFLLVTSIAAGASLLLQRRLTLRFIRVLHVICWVSFYSWFFHVMVEVS